MMSLSDASINEGVFHIPVLYCSNDTCTTEETYPCECSYTGKNLTPLVTMGVANCKSKAPSFIPKVEMYLWTYTKA